MSLTELWEGVLWCNLLLFLRWQGTGGEIIKKMKFLSFFLCFVVVVVFWCGMFQESFTFFPTCWKEKKTHTCFTDTNSCSLGLVFTPRSQLLPFLCSLSAFAPKKRNILFLEAQEKEIKFLKKIKADIIPTFKKQRREEWPIKKCNQNQRRIESIWN